MEIKAIPTCRCFEYQISKNIISPLDSCIIAVRFDTNIKVGKIINTLKLYANDPYLRIINLNVYADIYKRIEFIPEEIWLGKVKKNTHYKRKIEIILEKDTTILKKNAPSNINIYRENNEKNNNAIIDIVAIGEYGFNESFIEFISNKENIIKYRITYFIIK